MIQFLLPTRIDLICYDLLHMCRSLLTPIIMDITAITYEYRLELPRFQKWARAAREILPDIPGMFRDGPIRLNVLKSNVERPKIIREEEKWHQWRIYASPLFILFLCLE